MHSVLWWRLAAHLWQILVIVLLLVSEKVVGVPFASWVWFHHWYGAGTRQNQWYLLIVWAVIHSFLYQLPLGSSLLLVLAWFYLVGFWHGQPRLQTWWLVAMTSLVALAAYRYFQLDGIACIWWVATHLIVFISLQRKSKYLHV